MHIISSLKLSYFVAPNASGLPAEFTPKVYAASMAAYFAKFDWANPK